MPAAQKFLVNLLVARATVPGRYRSGDNEAVVLFFLLPLLGLMAIEAGNPLCGVFAQFELVNDGVLLIRVALRAFSGGFDKIRAGLIHLNSWASALDQKGAEYEREGNT
jgi:hypothetical protein